MADRRELEKQVADAKTALETLRKQVADATQASNKAWESRNREAFNEAENARLTAEASLAKAENMVKRAEGALEDFGKQDRRDAFDPMREAIRKAVVTALEPYKQLIAQEPDIDGVRFDVGFRQEGKLNATGPSVSVTPHGSLFRRVASGGGGRRTAGSHYTFTYNGNTYSEAELVKGFADKVWDGDKLDKVMSNAKGENRIRNALRIAKELEIVPTPIEAS